METSINQHVSCPYFHVFTPECAVNQCPGGETCFDRNVDAQPSFVCECDAPTEMGYNCLTPTAGRFLCFNVFKNMNINL